MSQAIRLVSHKTNSVTNDIACILKIKPPFLHSRSSYETLIIELSGPFYEIISGIILGCQVRIIIGKCQSCQ